jgi:sigma-B regulation protein RsbU (phosphoserine phosphatase)
MPVVDPHITASDLLRVFHRDEPYLFLGAAFTTVAIVAAAFSFLRRKLDSLTIYFALFAFLYGQRLWVQAGVLEVLVPPPNSSNGCDPASISWFRSLRSCSSKPPDSFID